jgi:glycosyltransferase involved in cell wall biosynthesis
MIVRNEEAHLPGCLDSVRGVADEIIIVDTGSSDGTVRIAESYGVGEGNDQTDRPVVRVHHTVWTGDFSVARNLSLEHANGEWILYLDADERLAPGEADRLRPLLESDEYGAIQVIIRNLMPEGNLVRSQSHRSIRLWRNRPDIRFEGMVHNQIAPAIERTGVPLLVTDVLVEHLGYAEYDEHREARRAQLMEMLASDTALHPDDPFAHYNYGVALHSAGIRAQAKDELHHALIRGGETLPPEILHNTLTRLAQIAVADRDLDEAERHATRAIELDPREPLPHYLMAAVHFEREAYSDALSSLGRVLEITINTDGGPLPLMEIDLAEVYTDIGNCYYKLGLFDLAEVEYRRALDEKPSAILFFNFGSSCLQQGKLDEAISAYRDALRLDSALDPARQALDFCLKLLGTSGDNGR